MSSSQKLFSQISEEKVDLGTFCQSILPGQHLLAIIGGGTAALTYLYTHDLEDKYTHIVILGDRGYWETASHRLGQPHHMLALPHRRSDRFVNPAEQDKQKGIFPHQSESAYIHSRDFQSRLIELEKATIKRLTRKGKKILIARNILIKKIEKISDFLFCLHTNPTIKPVHVNKIIIASGSGPTRRLPAELLPDIANEQASEVHKRVLDYTDVLTPSVVKMCEGKNIMVYGGGATAAWAIEVATSIAKPIAWVAKSGFDDTISAGSRVTAIVEKSRSIQLHGKIESITYQPCPRSKEHKLCIRTSSHHASSSSMYFFVDYLFNCIGQEPYELGGVPHLISKKLTNSLVPYADKNLVTGSESILGWATHENDLMIIGAAHGTFYDRDRPSFFNLPAVSRALPRSGRVPMTVSGVVSSVCALANYMPITQDLKTGQVKLKSLNPNIMNATQLAVYFTACYPCATAKTVNQAVANFISERYKTEFGLSDDEVTTFEMMHFGHLSTLENPISKPKSKL